MKCPRCGREMQKYETLDNDMKTEIIVFTCNNVDCDFDEERIVKADIIPKEKK